MPKEKQNIIYKKMGSAKRRRDGLLDVEHNISKFLLKHPELKKYEGDLRKETQHFQKVYKFQYLPHYYFYDIKLTDLKRQHHNIGKFLLHMLKSKRGVVNFNHFIFLYIRAFSI